MAWTGDRRKSKSPPIQKEKLNNGAINQGGGGGDGKGEGGEGGKGGRGGLCIFVRSCSNRNPLSVMVDGRGRSEGDD